MKIAGTITTWGILGVLKVFILFLRFSYAADINQFITLNMEVWVFFSVQLGLQIVLQSL